jgi:hypothetical protein
MDTHRANEGWHRLPHYVIGGVLGILVLVGVPELTRWLHGGAFAQNLPQLPPPPQSVPGNCNNFGFNNGMMNCGTLNIGPMPRRLSDPRADSAKRQILSEFSKDKSYNIVSVWGDNEAFQFAFDILDFMKANNFKVTGVDQAAFTRPVTGLIKEERPDGVIQITVGANR